MFFSGCRTVAYQSVPLSIWPPKSSDISLYYVPQKLASAEEAIGTIKNLQQDFVEWRGGYPISSLEVDAFGMRARWNWTQTMRQAVATPTYGAMWVGWNYIPTYSTTYQVQTIAQPRTDMFIIPFNEVIGLELHHMLYSSVEFRWGLTVALSGGRTVYVRVSDEEHLEKLANSIATLAMARGVSFPKFWFGCVVSSLNGQQSERLGLATGTGILVVDVAKNSSAEKAGIQFLDVLLEFDGRSCNRPEDLGEAVKNAYATGKKSVTVKLARLEKVSRQVEDPRTKQINTELVEEKAEKIIQAALNY